MKIIKLIGNSYDKGYHYDMNKTGEIITPEKYVNVNTIESLENWEGKLLCKGEKGTKVTLTSGDCFIDHRNPIELKSLLSTFAS